jgi:S1-C subfamily serine protease
MTSLAGEESLQKSVVKIFTVYQPPNYYQPWEYGHQKSSGGSGCILDGRRILTNAHVVHDQVYVQVQRAGGASKYDARVEFVDHECETALLTVEDRTFFKDSIPVEFGDLPVRRDKVAVHGFPIGGDELSITEGVVSRIEVRTYTHSQRDLLALQTDAAINPGNSGGPVFKDGKLIGIAFESYSGTGVENTGYVVPINIIRHFLSDVEDGVRDGIPDLGICWQAMESASLREFHRLKPSDTGILVLRTVYEGSSHGVLQDHDVITHVDGVAVANDGSIQSRKNERLNFSYLVSEHHIGEIAELTILRSGEPMQVGVKLTGPKYLVKRPRYDVRPTYFLFAGIIFMPLSHNYMRLWDWEKVETRFRYYYSEALPSASRKELVIVNQVLAHEINVGYHMLHNSIVDRINHHPISEMKDVLAAFEKPIGTHHVIDLDNAAAAGRLSRATWSPCTRVVIDASRVKRATEEILARFAIGTDRSEDLKPKL